MKTEAIIKKLSEIPGGRFFRVRYISKVPVSSTVEKDGISIFKIVDTTTRTGVKYNNIDGVVPASYSEKDSKVNNWEWVVKDRIKHNTKTGKDYLVIAPIGKGAHTITTYIFTDKNGVTEIIDKEAVAEYAIPSYWRDEKKPVIMNVTLENVLLVK